LAHKNLEAWKKSMALVVEIYHITKTFPKDEMYGLVNQIRRCAVSIPSNIAEGCARQTSKETIQFLYIALGSTAELETQLLISAELGYIEKDTYIKDVINIRSMLLGLIKYLKSKK
jgi:four helix bundle protein